MNHIKTFESFSADLENVEIIDEGLFTSVKKIIAKIAGLSVEKAEEVKNVFVELFQEASKVTDLSRKFWAKVKILIDKMSTEDMLKILNQAKADYEANGAIGYVVEANGKVGYKASTSVKTARGIGGHNFGEGA
jgi:hypothetical protein